MNDSSLNEKTNVMDYVKSEHLKIKLQDANDKIKKNNLQQITNPITFQRNNIPTPDGLLSNEIFGITMDDRSNICGYIDLHKYFINPLAYKIWNKLDKNISKCVHGITNFVLDKNGNLVEDEENGETGLDFIIKNIDKINIKRTDSVHRDLYVDFIEKNRKEKNRFFTNKVIVIPPFYRDVDTSKVGKVAIGEINEIYRNIIISARALYETSDYGLDIGEANRGRIQDLLVTLFDWFGTGTVVNGTKTGNNIPGKLGIIRRSIYSVTTDYATRLVITAPELKYDKYNEIPVDLDTASVSLGSVLKNFEIFIIYYLKNLFENAFAGDKEVPIIINNEIKYCHVQDYQEQFSETRIKKEINRFLKGASNRLIPLTVKTVEYPDKLLKMKFKGYNTTLEKFNNGLKSEFTIDRDYLWCDLFYMAAVEMTKDKHIIVVRYPIDSIYNQVPVKIHVNSTNETEPMIINGVFYEFYPKIRQDQIGKDTSHLFIDSLNVSNLYLAGMNGDYDGDQTTVKGVFTDEANRELDEIMKNKYMYIDAGGEGIREASNESIQSMYNMTLVLPGDENKLSKPVF